MAKREIQAGDYFLLPYAGPRRNRLVKAVQLNTTTGHWYVSNEAGMTSQVLLSSCHRCSPSVAARICKTPAGVPPSQGLSTVAEQVQRAGSRSCPTESAVTLCPTNGVATLPGGQQ